MKNESGYTSGYFTLSVALHSLAVLGIILLPQMELLEEGSGHAIEFVAMSDPKGEQLETPVVGEKEVIVEKPVKKPVQAAAAEAEVKTAEAPLPSLEDLKPKNDPPLPENLDSEISNEEPKAEKIATVLPDKKQVSEPEPEPEPTPEPAAAEPAPEDTKYDDFLADESDAVTKEAETAALAIATVEDTPAPEETRLEEKPEPAPAVAEEEPKNEPQPVAAATPVEEEDPFAAEEADALAAANVSEPAQQPQKPVAEAPRTGTGTTQKSPAEAQNQSDQAYGKPSGTIRSYTDLSQIQGNKPPTYPTLARRMSQQGQVKLAYFVNADGSVGQMKLVQSSGHQLLDREAVRAVSQYRYKPGQAGWTLHPVNFTLQGPVKKMPSRLRTSGRSGTSVNR